MVDRGEVDWRNIRLKSKTRVFLEALSQIEYEDFVQAVILFGSEARGEATIKSDVDIAIISTRPLNHKERYGFLMDVPGDVKDDVDYQVCCIRTDSLYTDKLTHIGTSIKKEGLIIYEKLS